MLRTGVPEGSLEASDAPLSSRAMPHDTRLPPETPPPPNVDAFSNTPRAGPPLQKHKKSRNEPNLPGRTRERTPSSTDGSIHSPCAMVAPAVARPARPAPARALGGGLPTTTGPASVLRTHRCVHPAAPSGAHLKIVLGRSSTLLLRASPTLKSHGSHPPAAAGCRSPCHGRCGKGAGHGRRAARVNNRIHPAGTCHRVPAGDPPGRVAIFKVRLLRGIAHNLPVRPSVRPPLANPRHGGILDAGSSATVCRSPLGEVWRCPTSSPSRATPP